MNRGRGLKSVALHGHRMLQNRSSLVPARLTGWNSSSMMSCVLFGIQVSGTYWSLRYRVGLRVGKQRQLVLGPVTLVERVRLQVYRLWLGMWRSTWMGKSGMGLWMWRMRWKWLPMGWSRKLGCRVRKVRR